MCKLTLTAALCLIIACFGLPGIEAHPVFGSPCAGKPDGKYPNPADQHSFISCLAERSYIQPCPGDLVYNSAYGVCTFPYGYTAFSCAGKPTGQYPNPRDQHSFFYCDAGRATLKPCPAGLVYNAAIQVCAFPDSPVNNANDCVGKRDGQYTNPRDPHSFLSCVAGLTYIMQCPANLVYVQAYNACDYPK